MRKLCFSTESKCKTIRKQDTARKRFRLNAKVKGCAAENLRRLMQVCILLLRNRTYEEAEAEVNSLIDTKLFCMALANAKQLDNCHACKAKCKYVRQVSIVFVFAFGVEFKMTPNNAYT